MCKVSDNGVSTEDCRVCTCQTSGAAHTPQDYPIKLTPDGPTVFIRKCSACGRAC